MGSVIKFSIQCLLFVLVTIISSYIFDSVYMNRHKDILRNYQGLEVYRSIYKSKKRVPKRKLIIGDSTGNQFFDNRHDDEDFYSLACNQAISLCGQYMLLNNFLVAGNRPEEVYLIYHPNSFSIDLDSKFTFHYFLKPFYRKEYKTLMTENVTCQIQKVPYYWLASFPLINWSAWTPKYIPDSYKKPSLSLISMEYLRKMFYLKEKYRFNLYIVPTFVKESIPLEIDYCNINENKVKDVMSLYTNNIHHLPDTCFVDNLHLKTPTLYKNMMMNLMSSIKEQMDACNL